MSYWGGGPLAEGLRCCQDLCQTLAIFRLLKPTVKGLGAQSGGTRGCGLGVGGYPVEVYSLVDCVLKSVELVSGGL